MRGSFLSPALIGDTSAPCHNSHVKSSILAAILTTALLLAPIAHAQTSPVPIGNPATDTLQLWEAIASAIENIADETMAAAGHVASAVQGLATPHTSQPSAQSASPATAVALFQETQEATSTPLPPAAQTSTSNPSTPQPIIERITQYEPLAPSGFVTQDELASQLQQLSNALAAKIDTAPAPSLLPQNVAADGNPDIPYAAENAINNLSNVTISNANLTASEKFLLSTTSHPRVRSQSLMAEPGSQAPPTMANYWLVTPTADTH